MAEGRPGVPRGRLASAGVSHFFLGVKTKKNEKWCQHSLANPTLYQLLGKVDEDLAESCRQDGCSCGGTLHSAKYRRKPRGGPKSDEETWRHSFCCDLEGCRKRHTPASVRFLGRRVYWGLSVVLLSAMSHGLNPGAVRILRESLGVDRRTLERWRQWWREAFVQSRFWKAARARFSPLLCEKALPWSLCESFGFEPLDRLLALMKFLAPLSVPNSLEIQPM